ncbi:MAG: hypothetical protein WKG07_39315 [Hymenobacter sp.]
MPGFLLLLGLFAAVVLINYRLAGQVLRNSQRVESFAAHLGRRHHAAAERH